MTWMAFKEDCKPKFLILCALKQSDKVTFWNKAVVPFSSGEIAPENHKSN